jgi:hypothetical protein
VARGDFKADPREIIRAHRRTYVDVRTGRPLLRDRVVFEVLPVAAAILCLIYHVVLSAGASAGLLAVSGLLGALLFGVVVQLSGTAIDLADSQPEPGPATSAYATYLQELAANASYASLTCITAAIIFVVASIGSGWTLRISSAVGLGLSAHLALVLAMVMKRVFALTEERLRRARTGADRPTNSRAA